MLTDEQITELDRRILKAVRENHIWLNAFACVRPTTEFKIELADAILAMLCDKDALLPAGEGLLGELTPMLYLSINKS